MLALCLCWISNAIEKYDIISEINHAIDKGFRENGIESPFPQWDLHLCSAKREIRFYLETEEKAVADCDRLLSN